MNLQHLTDQVLLEKIDLLVQAERELLTEILHHLREVERRRLFSALGFSSLHDYAIQHLKYSADQAARRVQAMRLLRDLPEIESAIDSGHLTLTHLGLAQGAFQREKKAGRPFSLEMKKALVEKIAGATTREAEKLTLEAAPIEFASEDRIRLVSSEDVEIKFHAKVRVREKLERLQGLLAHQQLSMGDLVEKLCDLGLEYFDPAKTRGEAKGAAQMAASQETENQIQTSKKTATLKRNSAIFAAPRKLSKAAIYREVWRRDRNRCVKCGGLHALQIDHINPRALGGQDSSKNLRILCRSCNQRAAIEKLGLSMMDRHLNQKESRPRLLPK